MPVVVIPKLMSVIPTPAGLVDGAGTTYPNGALIIFKDATAQTAIVNAICQIGNWAAIDQTQTPITKGAFAMRELQNHLRNWIISARTQTAQAAIVPPDLTDLP